jgi:glutathione S-transferase
VPTVVLEDGRPLAESNAILWYFADGSPYVPDDPYERAQVLQWMFFEQYKHEPAIAVVRFWVTIADIALYAYTHVAPEGGFELEPYPAVRRWLERIAAQAGIVPITA